MKILILLSLLMLIIPGMNASLSIITSQNSLSSISQFPYLTNSTLVHTISLTQFNPSNLLIQDIPQTEITCGGLAQSLDRTLRNNIIRILCRNCYSQDVQWLLKYSYTTSDYLLGVHAHVFYLDSGEELNGSNYTLMNEILNQRSKSPAIQLVSAQYQDNNFTVKSYSTNVNSRKDQHVVIDIQVVCKQPRNETLETEQVIYLNGQFGILKSSTFAYLYIVLSVAIVVSVCALGCIILLVCVLCEKRTRKSLRRYSVILKNNNAWSMMREEEISSFDGSQRSMKDIDYVMQTPINV